MSRIPGSMPSVFGELSGARIVTFRTSTWLLIKIKIVILKYPPTHKSPLVHQFIYLTTENLIQPRTNLQYTGWMAQNGEFTNVTSEITTPVEYMSSMRWGRV